MNLSLDQIFILKRIVPKGSHHRQDLHFNEINLSALAAMGSAATNCFDSIPLLHDTGLEINAAYEPWRQYTQTKTESWIKLKKNWFNWKKKIQGKI